MKDDFDIACFIQTKRYGSLFLRIVFRTFNNLKFLF